MNLYQLHYFVKLAHLQHYTNAAGELHITQPNLTHAIQSMEEELGVSLFEKRGRNVVLTKYGKDFLVYAEQSLAVLHDGVDRMKQVSEGRETIRLGFLRTLGTAFVPGLLSEYAQTDAGRKVSFTCYDGITGELAEMLKKGECDLIFSSRDEGESDIEYIPIVKRTLCLIVSKENPLAGKEEISLEETKDCPYILFHPKTGMRSFTDALFARHHFEPKCLMEIEEDADDNAQCSGEKGDRQDFMEQENTEKGGSQCLYGIESGTGIGRKQGEALVPQDIGECGTDKSHIEQTEYSGQIWFHDRMSDTDLAEGDRDVADGSYQHGISCDRKGTVFPGNFPGDDGHERPSQHSGKRKEDAHGRNGCAVPDDQIYACHGEKQACDLCLCQFFLQDKGCHYADENRIHGVEQRCDGGAGELCPQKLKIDGKKITDKPDYKKIFVILPFDHFFFFLPCRC